MRLLIVEERDTVRTALIASLVQAEVGEVRGTPDPITALNLIAQWRPDVILLETKRKDGKGIEICRMIRAAAPKAQLLIVTSYPDALERLVAVNAGADGYLMKDADLAPLVTRLRQTDPGSSPRFRG